ncbi:hypothetical protein HY024_02790 [Candidatus Curtissbacteria bacterium]|nr:hypothetical protein [Candidatus Curtissbacteria bacterium]
MAERDFSDKPISPVDSLVGAMARDLSRHPTPEMIGSSIFEPDVLQETGIGSFVARVVSVHFSYCGDCTDIRNSIERQVESRKAEFYL